MTEQTDQQTQNPREWLVNRNLNPLLADLPAKFERYAPHQVAAIDQVVRELKRGVRVVLLDAPTGTGKTLIGETVRRMMKVRAVYSCSDKELQHQFVRDFPEARLLMGRGNYPTLRFASSFHPGRWEGHISAEDCTWDGEKSFCDLCGPNKSACPYEQAKHEALASALPVLNISYLLTEANGPGRFSGRNLAIIDEADLLESQLMNWVSVEVSKFRMNKYGWEAPKLTVEADWLRWCKEKQPEVRKRAGELRGLGELTVQQTRELKFLDGLAGNLRRIVSDIEGGTSAWVYDGDRERVSFKPSRVVHYGESSLWSHAKQWLLMSASIISADEMMFSLGFREGEFSVVRVPSTFPPERRKVHIIPVADMSRKGMGKDDGLLMGEIRRIAFRHPDDRILIHTVSYDRTDKVAGTLRRLFPNRAVLAYRGATERAAALAKYKATPRAILCGPSLDRGVDLPGDLCRVQVICKVPFPNLGDKVVSARYHSGTEGKTWYTVQTVRTLVQMTGRAVRSQEDWAETYILDKGFNDQLWSRGGRGLFPEWWRDGLVWERVQRS